MLRIIDANLNRLCEGLRVLEDITRFILNDPDLTEKLKTLRHNVVFQDSTIQEKLLNSRNITEDVGAFIDIDNEGIRENTTNLVTANAHRAQQALRVLEEIAKLPHQDIPLDWQKIQRTRFQMYELQQIIISRLLRLDKINKIRGLYLILDIESSKDRNPVQIAQQAITGGARLIQIRDKKNEKGTLLPISIELQKICHESGVLFIVNDHIDLALSCDADGVHIGQNDLPVSMARKLLPSSKIIGCSTATFEEARHAKEEGADYIAVGSVYPTDSKRKTRSARLETIQTIKEYLSIPVVAIGGINTSNVADVIAAGADSVAVISAILKSDDIRKASQNLTSILEEGDCHDKTYYKI